MPRIGTIPIQINGNIVHVKENLIEYRTAEIISYEKLLEFGEDVACEGDSVEDAILLNNLMDKLKQALDTLSDEERKLIHALFFSNDGVGMSERPYAKSIGVAQKTINNRKKAILRKLKYFLET